MVSVAGLKTWWESMAGYTCTWRVGIVEGVAGLESWRGRESSLARYTCNWRVGTIEGVAWLEYWRSLLVLMSQRKADGESWQNQLG